MISMFMGHKRMGGKATVHSAPRWLRRPGQPDGEDNRQRHIVEMLWIAMAIFIAVCVGLLYAEYHGFGSAANQTPPPAPWPVGLP